jgi:hypothetical protein
MGQDRNSDSKDREGRDRDRVDTGQLQEDRLEWTLDRIEGTGWDGAETLSLTTPKDETVAGGHRVDETRQRVQALPRVHSLLA